MLTELAYERAHGVHHGHARVQLCGFAALSLQGTGTCMGALTSSAQTLSQSLTTGCCTFSAATARRPSSAMLQTAMLQIASSALSISTALHRNECDGFRNSQVIIRCQGQAWHLQLLPLVLSDFGNFGFVLTMSLTQGSR